MNLENASLDDLKKIPLARLLDIQSDLILAIEERKINDKQELIEKLSTLATESGFSINELFSKKVKKTVPVKYRNPDNSLETWTGRGRKPKWIQEYIASGKNLEDVEV